MPTSKDSEKAIGVFDSGLGGLTVVKELMKQLPNENIVYFGDTARVPYGIKSKDSIIRYSKENSAVLLKHKVKMIVVACNSCSSYALTGLRKKFKLPILGVIEPGAKKAVFVSQKGRVGVIATSATIKSGSYVKALKRQKRTVRVFSQVCALFVPLVEEGWADKTETVQIAKAYLKNLKKENIDALILGCTHYPLLKKTLRKVLGGKIRLIDSAEEVAGEVKSILIKSQSQRRSAKRAQYKFLISDKPQEFQKIAREFLGRNIKVTLTNV